MTLIDTRAAKLDRTGDHARLAELQRPFPPEQVSWRVGATDAKRNGGKASKGQPLAYIDARDVMERLDTVVGPAGWQDSYQAIGNGTMVCTLQIKVDGEWVAKSDGAGASDKEPEKGAISDAFKRAAVKWGIGRYLYDVRAPWVPLTDWGGIPDGELPKLRALLTRHRAAGPVPPVHAGLAGPADRVPPVHAGLAAEPESNDDADLVVMLRDELLACATPEEIDDWVDRAKGPLGKMSDPVRAKLRKDLSDQRARLRPRQSVLAAG